jgi:CHAD domain-containing protein
MAPSGKWIDGIDADGSIEEAARVSLEARLAAVRYWLPLAAYLAEHDIEHVHRLRVSTRRAMAALRLYDDWLPRKPARSIRKRLKKIRRAAGDARDLDVLANRLSHDYEQAAEPIQPWIAQRRARVQRAIEKVADRSRRRERFARKIVKVTSKIRTAGPGDSAPVQFRQWAGQQLHDATGNFFAELPDESADVETLHQFRIRGKELRYTIELVAPAFGPDLRAKYYPVVESLQEKLGDVQDHVTASDRLRGWAEEMHDSDHKQTLLQLASEEGRRLEEQLQQFRKWWTPARIQALRQGLMPEIEDLEMVSSPTPTQ